MSVSAAASSIWGIARDACGTLEHSSSSPRIEVNAFLMAAGTSNAVKSVGCIINFPPVLRWSRKRAPAPGRSVRRCRFVLAKACIEETASPKLGAQKRRHARSSVVSANWGDCGVGTFSSSSGDPARGGVLIRVLASIWYSRTI